MANRIATLLVELFAAGLRWADIRGRPFWALVAAYVKLDLRNPHFGRATATGPLDVLPPLFWVTGQYLLLSGAVAGLLFARVDAFFFTLVALTVSMLVMASAMIVEFNEVVLDPGDLEIVGHLPIPVRTYAAARLTNLLAYVLLVTAALNLFPAVVGVGLRDAGWLFLPAYAVAALVGNLAVAEVVILLYTTVLRSRLGEAARTVLAWAQIVLMNFYTAQLLGHSRNQPLALMTGWHLWSLLRGVGYLFITFDVVSGPAARTRHPSVHPLSSPVALGCRAGPDPG